MLGRGVHLGGVHLRALGRGVHLGGVGCHSGLFLCKSFTSKSYENITPQLSNRCLTICTATERAREQDCGDWCDRRIIRRRTSVHKSPQKRHSTTHKTSHLCATSHLHPVRALRSRATLRMMKVNTTHQALGGRGAPTPLLKVSPKGCTKPY